MKVAKRVALFVLYVWLCREFYVFNVIDACLDGGGVYDAALRGCSIAPFGQQWDVGARSTFVFWVILLGVPALFVVAIDILISKILVRFRRRHE